MPVDSVLLAKSSSETSNPRELMIELKQLKKELKEWEHQFQAENEGRKPSKQDIAANKDISRRYKAYAKLKAATATAVEEDNEPKHVEKELNVAPMSATPRKSKEEPSVQEDVVAQAAEQDDEAKKSKKATRSATKSKRVSIRAEEEAAPSLERPTSSKSKNEVIVERTPSTKSNQERPTSSKSRNSEMGRSSTERKSSSRDASQDLEDSGSKPNGKRKSLRNQNDEAQESPSRSASPHYQVQIPEVTRDTSEKNHVTHIPVTTVLVEERMGWGASSGLPENFRIRKSTIPTGPMPSAGPAAAAAKKFVMNSDPQLSDYPSNNSPVQYSSTSPLTAAATALSNGRQDTFIPLDRRGGPEYDSVTYFAPNEFNDFINRRKEVETYTTSPTKSNHRSSPTQNAFVQSRPQSPTRPNPVQIQVQPLQPHLPSPDPSSSMFDERLLRKAQADSVESLIIAPPSRPVQAFLPPPTQVKQPEQEPTIVAPPAVQSNASPEQAPQPPRRKSLPERPVDTSPQSPVSPAENTQSPVAVTSKTDEAVSSPSSNANPSTEEDKEDLQNAISPIVASNGNAASTSSSTVAGENLTLGLTCKLPLATGLKLFKFITADHILRCRMFRKKNLLDKNHPIFYLFNEADDKFMMAARKKRKSKTVNYLISSSPDDLSKESKHYIAKLKANSQRTNFILYDARYYNKKADNKGLKEIGCVSYVSNSLNYNKGSNRLQSKTVLPREVNAAVPAISIEDNETPFTKDIMADVKSQNADRLVFLKNKPPRWNEATQSHCLNFGGRVTLPSIKNFQLIGEKDEAMVLLQFGRCGAEFFTLDARAPLTPLAAFAIALSSFDAYDNA